MNKFIGEFEIKKEKELPTEEEIKLVKDTNYNFTQLVKKDIPTPKEKELDNYVKKTRDKYI
jgi:hypothetical protein